MKIGAGRRFALDPHGTIFKICGMTQLPTPVEEQSAPSLFDRTIENLRSAWRDIAAFSREAVGATPRPHLPREDADRIRLQMQACLEGRGGEVSARAAPASWDGQFSTRQAAGTSSAFWRVISTWIAPPLTGRWMCSIVLAIPLHAGTPSGRCAARWNPDGCDC